MNSNLVRYLAHACAGAQADYRANPGLRAAMDRAFIEQRLFLWLLLKKARLRGGRALGSIGK